MTPRRTPLSIVVPIYNEEANLRLLVDRVREYVDSHDWELLLVDDGSTDGSVAVARKLAEEDPRVRPLVLARNYGQTLAMRAGFEHSRGEVVVTMDADLQNDPADVPHLLETLEEGYDLVTGYRVRRKDHPIRRKLPSWVANRVIAAVTGVPIRDNGCSLKAYRRDLLDRLHIYSDMHRFLPALAASTGGARITEVPVRHHPRRFGESKYGLGRIWKVTLDLIAIETIRRFRSRPLVLFGGMATVSAVLGLICLGIAWLIVLSPAPLRAAVFPGAGLLLLGLAGYLVLLGLVGEVTVRESFRRPRPLLPLLREIR